MLGPNLKCFKIHYLRSLAWESPVVVPRVLCCLMGKFEELSGLGSNAEQAGPSGPFHLQL